jgi:hypothetical protein
MKVPVTGNILTGVSFTEISALHPPSFQAGDAKPFLIPGLEWGEKIERPC